MKKLATLVLFGAGIVLLLGCASSGPSPEERANELERQREAERQQAEFRKSLPPVTNPGRGEWCDHEHEHDYDRNCELRKPLL